MNERTLHFSTHPFGCRCKTKPGMMPKFSQEPIKKLSLPKGPKVSRRKIGSKPRMNIWRQMNKKAMQEIMELEDQAWLELVEKELKK